MRWIPWLIALILAVVDAAVYQTAQKQIAAQQAAHKQQEDAEWKRVETAQASVVKKRDDLEAMLEKEEAETSRLRAGKEKLTGERDELKTAIATAEGEIADVKAARDEAARKTEENKATLQDIQIGIATRERDIGMLQKLMPTVMEAHELTGEGM